MLNKEFTPLNIVLVGSGNLAYSLALAVSNSPNKLLQIISQNTRSGNELAGLAGCEFNTELNSISTGADLCILAIPDGAIAQVATGIKNSNATVVHTSGSTPMVSFSRMGFSNYGVFYPFQTFTFSRAAAYSKLPVCIEASNNQTLELLNSFALSLGAQPVEMDSETRKWLHLSGVFACNFVNHMLSLSQLIAQEKGIDSSLLEPLIKETVFKALEKGPLESQTGPALRGDTETLKRHYMMLGQLDDELRDLYIALSTSIERLHKEMEP